MDYDAKIAYATCIDLQEDIDHLIREVLSHETSINSAVGQILNMVAKAHMRGTLGEPVYGNNSDES